jgi:hypothetical protein
MIYVLEELKSLNKALTSTNEALVDENIYLRGCIEALTTGNLPQRASLEQFSMAMQGRKIAKLLKANQPSIKVSNEKHFSQESSS